MALPSPFVVIILSILGTITPALATASPAATTACVTPIDPLFAFHSTCAQACLGCVDSNESFAHSCELAGDCCQGPKAVGLIPLVYGCVKRSCSATDAQASWEEFLKACAKNGHQVAQENTPSGYSYIIFNGKFLIMLYPNWTTTQCFLHLVF